MKTQPLAEVFGFPCDNTSDTAAWNRKNLLCPFNNKVPNCTKDKAINPLGVCSIFDEQNLVITCPIRFRQNWTIAVDAADFFFTKEIKWTTLTEVRLPDKHGKSAGNIDVVLVAYDQQGTVIDFGALEVQAVYISGNVRNLFSLYMKDSESYLQSDFKKLPNYPRPDYLSSSRKRLAPQLIYKGGILHTWRKKIAVALNRGFYETLPALIEVDKTEADIVWLVYDLQIKEDSSVYTLQPFRKIYTKFEDSMQQITRSEAGALSDFMQHLQNKIDMQLDQASNPPDTETIDAPF